MSDDEFLYDEDDYLYFDDFPYIEADDLATHTIQSPVWANYDPSYETASIPSDWEYYSDDYWDEELTKKRTRKRDGLGETAAGGSSIGHGTDRKRRKLVRTEDVPGLSLGEPAVAAPTVIWKSKHDVLQPFEGPIVNEGQGERVSLLKDWRERFKVPLKQKNPVSGPFEMQRIGSQKAVAVVVNNQSAARIFGNILPPTVHSNFQGLPSRAKESRPKNDGTNRATNRTTRATSFQDVPPQEKLQTQSLTGASSAKSRKRKASDPSITPATVSRAATFNKRKVASIGGNIGMTESQRPIASQRQARKNIAFGTGERGLEVSDLVIGEGEPSGRKRRV